MTARSAYISALKLSFRNMNHTCSIRFDSSIMKRRCFFVFFCRIFFFVFRCCRRYMCSIFITIDYSITFTYVCACILYIYSRCIWIYEYGVWNAIRPANESCCIGIDKQREAISIFAIVKNAESIIFHSL